MNYKKLLSCIALGLGFCLSTASNAAILLQNPGSTTYQQTQNRPCVIGDNSCSNPNGFSSAAIPNGNLSSYDVTSPTYTVAQIFGILQSYTFFVGIDVNTTTQPLATEHLQLFSMTVNNNGLISTVAYQDNSGSGDTVGTQLYTNNNGNGYSDELLTGFDLSSFAQNATVTFRAIVNNPTDGKEQFFLISTEGGGGSNNVPEPGTVAMLGIGLIGLSYAAKRAKHGVS